MHRIFIPKRVALRSGPAANSAAEINSAVQKLSMAHCDALNKRTAIERETAMILTLEAVISRIEFTFGKGELHKYLDNNPQPDKHVLVRYLEGIKAGKCPDNSSEDCKVKAYALLMLLDMVDTTVNGKLIPD